MNKKIAESHSQIIYVHTITDEPQIPDFERHCHPYYELLYVLNGDGKYVVESEEYPLKANTLLIIRPYEFHYVCPAKNIKYERYVIHFYNESVMNETLSKLYFFRSDKIKSRCVYFSIGDVKEKFDRVFIAMDSACRDFEGKSNHHAKEQTMQTALLTQLLLLLSLEEQEQVVPKDENIMTKIIEYLNLHRTTDITLDEISQRFFISKYYLCRAFKEYTGASVMTYLCAKRIAMAEELIKQGEPSTTVAYQVGFKNYSSFYRSYSKYTGHAPVRSKKTKKQGEQVREKPHC